MTLPQFTILIMITSVWEQVNWSWMSGGCAHSPPSPPWYRIACWQPSDSLCFSQNDGNHICFDAYFSYKTPKASPWLSLRCHFKVILVSSSTVLSWHCNTLNKQLIGNQWRWWSWWWRCWRWCCWWWWRWWCCWSWWFPPLPSYPAIDNQLAGDRLRILCLPKLNYYIAAFFKNVTKLHIWLIIFG